MDPPVRLGPQGLSWYSSGWTCFLLVLLMLRGPGLLSGSLQGCLGFRPGAVYFPHALLGSLLEVPFPLVGLCFFRASKSAQLEPWFPFSPLGFGFQARCVPEHSYPLRRRRGGGRSCRGLSFPLWPLPFLILRELLLVLGLLNFCLKWLKPLPDFFSLFPSLFPLVRG